jgi:hypothetical protein
VPLFLEPNKKLGIWLESDKDKPVEERPIFFVRSLSMRQQEEISDAIEEAMKPDDTKDIFNANCDLLSKHITGWQNMGDFNHGEHHLKDFLSFLEARELLRSIMRNQYLQLDEKKSLEPQH